MGWVEDGIQEQCRGECASESEVSEGMGTVRAVSICLILLLVSQIAQAVKTAANVMVEIAFEAPGQEIDVLFVEPGGIELRVPAFWAGGRNWKVRYASP